MSRLCHRSYSSTSKHRKTKSAKRKTRDAHRRLKLSHARRLRSSTNANDRNDEEWRAVPLFPSGPKHYGTMDDGEEQR